MEISKQNIKDLIKKYNNKEGFIIYFYAEWCSYCSKFNPTWNKFSKSLKNKKINLFKIEDTQINLNKRYKLIKELKNLSPGYPSVFYVKNKNDVELLVGSDTTLKQLTNKMNDFFN
jgi:predicted bacteriocin transport accessory protein